LRVPENTFNTRQVIKPEYIYPVDHITAKTG